MAEEIKTEVAAAPAAETTNSIVDVLHYDPFAKGEEIPETKETSSKDAAKAGTEAGNETKVGEEVKTNLPAPNPAPDDSSTKDAQADYWRQIAEHQQGLLKGDKKEPEAEDKGQKVPEYNFTVPDKLIEALTSTEVPTFKKGVEALIQGMAAAVHYQMAAHMKAMYEPKFDGIPQQVMQMLAHQGESKRIETDFYGTYKELDHPQLRPMVQATAEKIAKEKGIKSWTPELKEETAKQVKALILSITGQPVQKPQAPKMVTNGSGARPAVGKKSEADDIAETLGFM